ncbi:hypothetical protein ACRYCC_27565 [Actinomadura scrupuli]|uniref:hypothetical protein n=1 Tax=Actinomadura scrupuli TaxID=559629 RepID=UPI003D96937A
MLLAMGIVVDEATGWLAERGFLTNVLSSLTGFFFAVPLAVLVLSEVNASQEERRAVRALLERAAATTESILSEATRLVQPEPDDLRRRAEATRRTVSALRTAIAPDADDRLSAASEALTGFLHGWTARWPDPSQVAASLLVMERRNEELVLISNRLSELTSPLDGPAHSALPLAAEAAMWQSADLVLREEISSALAAIRELRSEWATRPVGLDQATLRALVATTRGHDFSSVLSAVNEAMDRADRLSEIARSLDSTPTCSSG